MKNFLIALCLCLLLLFPQLAEAQTSRNPCYTTGTKSTQGIDNCVSVGIATPLPTYQGGASFTNITTSTDTVVKASAGTLQGFTVNTAGTSVVFYDNIACSGTKIGTFTATTQASIKIDAAFTVGLCATTVGGDITVLWR